MPVPPPALDQMSADEKRALLARLLKERTQSADAPFPLTPSQRTMWLAHQLAPESWAYHILFAGRVRSSLDVAAVRRAFQALVDRHPALRTTFFTAGGIPMQRVQATVPLDLPVTDITGMDEQDRYAAVLTEARRPFDLENGPVFRVHLFRTAPEEHILLLAVHHVAADYWSLAVLLDEFATLYAADRTGTPIQLTLLTRGYADFVQWQSQMLVGSQGQRLRAYWEQALPDEARALDLPTDHPRPPRQSLRGAAHFFHVESQLVPKLEALARSQNMTLYAVLLTAFQLLLHRYSGQDELLVGSPSAGRNAPEWESLVGLFANTMVLRANFATDQTFRELLRQVNQQALQAIGHQDYPFALMAERYPRDPGRPPVVQAMFALQKAPRLENQGLSAFMAGLPDTKLNLGGLVLEPYHLSQQEGQFDLTLSLVHQAGTLSGGLLYNTDLFTAATIARMAQYLERLLQAIVDSPDARLSNLSPSDPAAAAFSTGSALPALEGVSVHQRFEAHVRAHPNEPALVYDDVTLTYRELNQQANQLAHQLIALGVGPETPVGVFLDRSPRSIVSLLAIMKAGGVYLPLDPTYPPERLAIFLQDTGARYVLTARHLQDQLPQHAAQVVCLDDLAVHTGETPDPVVPLVPENLAYIIYTSGSTGRPKGVMIDHRGLLSHCQSIQADFQLTAQDRVLQFASHSFDVSLEQILPPLMTGATVVLRGDEVWGVQELPAKIGQLGLTVMNLPTAYWHQWLLSWQAAGGVPDLADLRLVIVGGEAMLAEPTRIWRQFAPASVRLLNAYGPTETVITATTYTIPPVTTANEAHRAIPIGQPLGNRSAYILDKHGRPVPCGVRGELYLGGINVARGYWGLPALTADRFVPDPFSDEPGRRLYRTGDLAAWGPGGTLTFFGRSDAQVKVRGYRIELGEIESLLGRHPDVADLVVVVREDVPNQRRLVAYVVLRPLSAASGPQLRSFLQEHLPEYMVPGSVVFLPALPLTPNGKVDRKALPAPDAPESETEPYAPPRTPLETLLADIWSAVLGRNPVGITQNFFELGGDSILAIQVAAQAAQQGLVITPKQLFDHPTIAALAQVIDVTGSAAPQSDAPVTGSVPLSPIQRWFFSHVDVDPHHFNQAILLQLRRPVPETALAKALTAVVYHHDLLRATFVCHADQWQQTISAPLDTLPINRIDLSDTPTSDRLETLRSAAQAVQSSFELHRGPLLKAALVTYGAAEPPELLLCAHHLVMDGVSWRILLEDLEQALSHVQDNRPVRLPRKTTSFQAWAARLQSYVHTDTLSAEAAHWLAQQGDLGTDALPVDHRLGSNTVASEETVTVELDADTTRALLRDAVRRGRVPAAEVLVAALASTMAHFCGNPRVRIDLEAHGREPLFPDVDLSRTVGWFTAMYPVVLQVAEDDPVLQVRAVAAQLRQVPNHGIGYGLLRYLGSDRATAAALADMRTAPVAFNYLGQFDNLFAQSALFRHMTMDALGPMRSPRQRRSHQNAVDALVVGGKLQVQWHYSRHLHERATMAELAEQFLHRLRDMLDRIGADPTRLQTPADFPLVSLRPAQLQRLLQGGQGIDDIYPLSYTQLGLLYHTLMNPTSQTYLSHLLCSLHGPLEINAFGQAWQLMVDRHPILRTGFHWEHVDEPVQVVRSNAALTIEYLDHRAIPHERRAQQLERLIQAIRTEGFDLEQPPLMRLHLVHLADDHYQLIWTSHHLLLDGWSMGLVIGEVLHTYAALCADQPPALPEPVPYGNYLTWLRQQDLVAAQRFWQEYLQGFGAPNPLGCVPVRLRQDSSEFAEGLRRLSPTDTAELTALARRANLTLNTLVQGAWTLMLHRLSRQHDIVFGATVSGRPPQLPNVLTTVGLLINTLPLRVQVPEHGLLFPWLSQIQARQSEVAAFEYAPLYQVQEWADVPRGTPLFHTMVAFENYPLDMLTGPGLQLSDLRAVEWTNYPLALIAEPHPTLTLRLKYHADIVPAAAADAILETLVNLLHWFARTTTPDLTATNAILTGLDPWCLASRNEVTTA